MEKPVQNSNALLDAVIQKLELRNDIQMARKLGLSAPQVSKLRHQKSRVTGDILLRMYDATGMSIEQLRGYLYP